MQNYCWCRAICLTCIVHYLHIWRKSPRETKNAILGWWSERRRKGTGARVACFKFQRGARPRHIDGTMRRAGCIWKWHNVDGMCWRELIFYYLHRISPPCRKFSTANCCTRCCINVCECVCPPSTIALPFSGVFFCPSNVARLNSEAIDWREANESASSKNVCAWWRKSVSNFKIFCEGTSAVILRKECAVISTNRFCFDSLVLY